jgi:hypothetical protein
MDESFNLPVVYKGEELLFSARLQQFGYTHRFVVDVYGQEVFFEPDEERNYRALVDPEQLYSNKKISIDLLQAISEGIEAILK